MLYEKIKMLAKQKKLSINQVEKDCGFSIGSLCKIDMHEPSASRLERLSQYFNLSLQSEINSCLINKEVMMFEIKKNEYYPEAKKGDLVFVRQNIVVEENDYVAFYIENNIDNISLGKIIKDESKLYLLTSQEEVIDVLDFQNMKENAQITITGKIEELHRIF